MADGKWIEGLGPDLPTEDAARKVLGVRLGVVSHYLPLAAERADEDIEYVHQLRVGTRRSGAALELFRDCLPERVYAKTRRVLKKLRRAAGAARDADVFAAALAEWGKGREEDVRPGLDFLIGFTHGQRQAAGNGLRSADAHQRRKLTAAIAAVEETLRRPHTEPRTLGAMAEEQLSARLRELGEATAAAAAAPADYERLHQVRIVGKQLRYAMEVFADCFGPEFRKEWYAAVEEMQEILGSANDSHVALARLADLKARLRHAAGVDWARLRPAVDGLVRTHQSRLPRERRRFQQWFVRWQTLLATRPLASMRISA